MNLRIPLRLLIAAAMLGPVILSRATVSRGDEPYLEFLAGLQQRGLGEAALDYLDRIEARKDTPVAIRQVFDLERSKSLRAAAGEAYNLEQKNQRLAEANKLLAKFLKEFPDHPAAAPALIGQADEILGQAQMYLGQSRATRVDAEKADFCQKAREQFAAASGQLQQIEGKLRARLDALPPVPPNGKPTALRLDVEFALLETRFKWALAEYSTALTYLDEKDPARKKILQQAGKSFDAVFQLHRGTRAGLLAHMWHGKVLEELGDEDTAMEVYDEVLVTDRNASLDDAALLGQAQLFRLQLMARKNDPVAMQEEATEWLKANRAWDKTSPYHGIALALGKSHIAAASKPGAIEPRKRYQAAAAVLLPVTKFDSEYKHEALLLRRECLEKLGGSGGNITADEEIALGDAAATEKDWAEATASYERALKLAETAKNDKLIAAAKQKLVQIRYQLAVQQFGEKKYEDALKAAGAIVRDAGEDPIAMAASGLAIASALEMYTLASPEAKPGILQRLERIANYTIEHWPDRAEADDARMALARASLTKGDEDEALAKLESVNAKSPRYGIAQNVVGQIVWKRYIDSKKQFNAATTAAAAADDPDSQANKDLEAQQQKLAELRTKARKSFKESMLHLKQVAVSDPERVDAKALTDVQLLAAESSLEDQLPADAAPLFAELVTQIEAKKPTEMDNTILRAFIGAVKSSIQVGDVDKGGAVALSLINLSPDDAKLNAVLTDFAKLIGQEVKKAEAEVTKFKAEAPLDLEKRKPAETLVASAQKVLTEMVSKLSERKELPIPALVYLGDTAVNLRLSELANSNYQRALQRIEKPQEGDDVATYAKASTRIRSQLISILRSDGKFEEANKQVDALIVAHPNSLEPKMEKGRILQSLAEKDPSRFDECVAHWANIRMLLGRIKNRPPEYYEVLYNCADCLLKQSLAEKDPTKAVEGEKILKSTMILTPSLNGPDTVAEYKALLIRLAAAAKLPVGPKPAATAKKGEAPGKAAATKTSAAPTKASATTTKAPAAKPGAATPTANKTPAKADKGSDKAAPKPATKPATQKKAKQP